MKKIFLLPFCLLCVCVNASANETTTSNANCGVNGVSCNDTPLINYDTFAQVHRIYAVDMTSHLNLSDNTNELIFEIQFDDEVKEDDNVRMHVIFERSYA